MQRPTIALVCGDPAGIGPELCRKLLAVQENLTAAQVIVIADPKVFGADVAQVADRPTERPSTGVTLWRQPGPDAAVVRGEASAAGGRYAIDTLRAAIDLTQAGIADAVLFAPLNKTALHQAGLGHEDESQWFAAILGAEGRPHGELNLLGSLWTSRVTSHVSIRSVPDLITEERIVASIRLAYQTVRDAGIASPRIAVCGLNPHNGENGSFGREEIDVIAPAVAAARAEGIPAVGPFPADTIFLRASDYDAIVTMYHDQGQIAMKLMGFDKGVTMIGGLAFPLCTPAHGTAYDIAGRGIADIGASREAILLAARMASRTRAAA